MSGTGIVIQGPLSSRGKTGRHAGLPTAGVPKSELRTVDCVPLIARLVEQARGTSISRIVAAVWESEDDDAVRRLPAEVEVVRVADPWAGGEDWHPMPNAPRQLVATRAGVRALVRGDTPDHVVKVRSDQVLDVAAVADWLGREDPAALGVPFLDRREPWMFIDFYLAGRTDVLLAVCDAVLAHQLRPFQPSIHDDVSLKLAFASTTAPHASLATYHLPPHRRYAAQRATIEHIVGELLVPLPRAVWEGVEWRGEGLRSSFPFADRIFAEDAAAGAVTEAVAEIHRTFVHRTNGPPALHLLTHPHGAAFRDTVLHDGPRRARTSRLAATTHRLAGRLRR